MIIGVGGSQIKLAKSFLAERNANLDYQEALEDLSGILLAMLENNMLNAMEEVTDDTEI